MMTAATTTAPPKDLLVISGGASHGATLWGAAKRAIEIHGPYSGYAGASIGAVIAAGLACGISWVVLERELFWLFQKNRITSGAKPIRFTPRLLWSRGGGLNDWGVVASLLRQIFGDKKFKDTNVPLAVCVGDVYLGKGVYITSKTHPEALIWEVLTASTAMWPVADAQQIPSIGTGNRLYVDGGTYDNIPHAAFVDSQERADIIFLGSVEPSPTRRDGFVGVALGVLDIMLYATPNVPHRTDDRLIPVQPEGSGLDFDLSPEVITLRIRRGYSECAKVLK